MIPQYFGSKLICVDEADGGGVGGGRGDRGRRRRGYGTYLLVLFSAADEGDDRILF
jgi:hypothetical protein